MKIGLETHVQVKTASKIFCSCKNPAHLKEEQKPNTLTCPTCLGLPGGKPVLNKAVVEAALRVGLAVQADIASISYCSRKTYFYPDMNKDYQITQYEIPLASNGFLTIGKKKIRIKRIHIEEDPAKLLHQQGYVLVDYNRAGIPLLEIVTEPDFSSPEEARMYLQKLEALLEYVGVYDPATTVMKSDANISTGGERIEIKNITGSKDVETALRYELVRQESLQKQGHVIEQETRGWNPQRGVTELLRTKESEEEYGYITEPDIPAIYITQKHRVQARKQLPELPEQKQKRYQKNYGLSATIAEALTAEPDIAQLFETLAKTLDPKLAGSWVAGPLKKTLNWNGVRWRDAGLKPQWIITTLKLYQQGKLSDRNTEITLRKMVEKKQEPTKLIKKYRLKKGSLDIEKEISTVLEANKKAVQDYTSGNAKALEFLLGQVIQKTQGRVTPQEVRILLKKMLRAS